jgi:hypothetical protein
VARARRPDSEPFHPLGQAGKVGLQSTEARVTERESSNDLPGSTKALPKRLFDGFCLRAIPLAVNALVAQATARLKGRAKSGEGTAHTLFEVRRRLGAAVEYGGRRKRPARHLLVEAKDPLLGIKASEKRLAPLAERSVAPGKERLLLGARQYGNLARCGLERSGRVVEGHLSHGLSRAIRCALDGREFVRPRSRVFG